jgi:hypothetical protein
LTAPPGRGSFGEPGAKIIETPAMFLRFVTTRIDEDSHRAASVFTAAYSLMKSETLNNEERRHLDEILSWFLKNLPAPPKNFDAKRATFWFKSGAKENIAKIWELAHFLRLHDHHVEVHKCRRLGNLLFEDKIQVAAYRSRLDGKITIQ